MTYHQADEILDREHAAYITQDGPEHYWLGIEVMPCDMKVGDVIPQHGGALVVKQTRYDSGTREWTVDVSHESGKERLFTAAISERFRIERYV